MADISLTIRLFGAFRAYGEKVTFTLPSACTVAEVKAHLAQELKIKDTSLLDNSALANDNEIIDDDAIFTQDSQLAILPPVCGG